MSLNWEAIGAMAESVGAVGIIVTLIYLTTEVRRNTRTARAAAAQASSASAQARLMALQTPEKARVWRVGSSDPESLDPDEQALFLFMLQATFRGFEDQFHQHREGLLSAEHWDSYARVFLGMMQRPGHQHFWSQRRDVFTTSFAEWVDSHSDSPS